MAVAAFFDLDRTLIAGSSAEVFGAKLAEVGIATPAVPGQFLLFKVYEKLGEDPFTMRLARGVARSFAGRRVVDVEQPSDGIAFGMGVKRGKPVYSVVARGSDAGLWEETLDTFLGAIAEQYGLPEEQVVEPHDQKRGVDVWYLGDDLTLALKDGLFLMSNDEGRLRDMIDLGIDSAGGEGSLVRVAEFAGERRCV